MVDTSVQEKEKDFRWVLSSRSERFLFLKVYNFNALNMVKESHDLQHGAFTKVLTPSAEVPVKSGNVLEKNFVFKIYLSNKNQS